MTETSPDVVSRVTSTPDCVESSRPPEIILEREISKLCDDETLSQDKVLPSSATSQLETSTLVGVKSIIPPENICQDVLTKSNLTTCAIDESVVPNSLEVDRISQSNHPKGPSAAGVASRNTSGAMPIGADPDTLSDKSSDPVDLQSSHVSPHGVMSVDVNPMLGGTLNLRKRIRGKVIGSNISSSKIRVKTVEQISTDLQNNRNVLSMDSRVGNEKDISERDSVYSESQTAFSNSDERIDDSSIYDFDPDSSSEVPAIPSTVKIVSGVCGGNLYTVGDGYFYRVKSKRENKIYLICKTRGCVGRAICHKDDLKVTYKHTCSSDPIYEDVVQLKKKILRRCAVDSKKLSVIFKEECKKVDPEVAAEVNFKQMESCMLKTRRTKLDVEGLARLTELAGGEEEDEDDDEENCCYRSAAFGKLGTVVWMSKDLGHLLHSNEWHLSICNPKPAPGSQAHLFTVLVVVHGMLFPVVLAYVETPSEDAYSAILGHLREFFPTAEPCIIVGDIEGPLVAAVTKHFPKTKYRGSWLHYAQAIITEAHRLELIGAIKTSLEARTCVKFLLGLSLLPKEVLLDTFEGIKAAAENLLVLHAIKPLLQYVEERWIKGYGVDELSMFNQPERCTNAQSSFHRELSLLLPVKPSLDLWDFTEGVSEVCRAGSRDYLSWLRGETVPSCRELVILTGDPVVAALLGRLSSGLIAPFDFLVHFAPLAADSILWEKRLPVLIS